jgi:cardiolipin synthase
MTATDGPNAARLSWIPNTITWSRLLAGPVVLGALVMAAHATNNVWALLAAGVYLYGATTDWLDGAIARGLNATSAYGAALDPKVDKLFAGGALIGLVVTGVLGGVHLIAVAALIGRDVWVSRLRTRMAAAGRTLPSTALAKAKTAIELTALGVLVCTPAAAMLGLDFDTVGAMQVGLIGVWIAAALAVWTGWRYARATQAALGSA